MTPRLTPELAVGYLAQLSTDLRAVLVLDGAGRPLAGEAALAEPARALLDATDAAAIEVTTDRGGAFAARTPAHAVVAVTGRHAVGALVIADLRAVVADLGPEAA